MITRITVSGGTYVRVTTGVTISQVQALILAAGIAAIRAEGSVVATGSDQTIEFSTAFQNTNYSLNILDYQGLGFELIEKLTTGFTCRFTESGLFDYIAIKNI